MLRNSIIAAVAIAFVIGVLMYCYLQRTQRAALERSRALSSADFGGAPTPGEGLGDRDDSRSRSVHFEDEVDNAETNDDGSDSDDDMARMSDLKKFGGPQGQVVGRGAVDNNKAVLVRQMSASIGKALTYLKFGISYQQVINMLPTMFSIPLPKIFSDFLKWLAWVNLDFVVIFANAGCFLTKGSFGFSLFMMTLGPLGLLLVIAIGFSIGSARQLAKYKRPAGGETPEAKVERKKNRGRAVRTVKRQAYALGFMVIHFAYAPVCFKVFQTFICEVGASYEGGTPPSLPSPSPSPWPRPNPGLR